MYYDGSAYRYAASDMSRATFAVVQVDGSGNRVATLSGTVPDYMPQTSQAAEHCGRLAAVQLLCGASVLTGDRKAILISQMPATRQLRITHACMLELVEQRLHQRMLIG